MISCSFWGDAERLKENNKRGDYWMEINGEDYILADKS